MHLCGIIQPGTNSQIGHLSGFCVTGADNLCLLDRVVITHCWTFYCIFIVFVKFLSNKRGFKVPHLVAYFQLLTISSLCCVSDNILVLFVSNLFLSVNLDHVIITYCWDFHIIFVIFSLISFK